MVAIEKRPSAVLGLNGTEGWFADIRRAPLTQ